MTFEIAILLPTVFLLASATYCQYDNSFPLDNGWYLYLITSILKETKPELVIDFDLNTPIRLPYKLCLKRMKLNYVPLKLIKLIQQPKLQFYRIFKHEFCTENYGRICISKSCRLFIVELRSRVLPLEIEVGCFFNKPLNERISNSCNNIVVDKDILSLNVHNIGI